MSATHPDRDKATLMYRACEDFLTLNERKLIYRAKRDNEPKFKALLRDAVVGKPMPPERFAKEVLRCAKLTLQPGAQA